MSTKRVLIRRAACALTAAGILAAPAVLFADDSTPAAAPAAAPAPAATAPAASPNPVPLEMDGIEMIGLKPAFDAAHLSASGFVEQGFTYNPDHPSDHLNAGRVFDARSNSYEFDQLGMYLERDLASGSDFDWGFKIEGLYGYDARFTHSFGLMTNFVGEQSNPYQGTAPSLDPVQFYALMRLPVGQGLTIKVGRYVTNIGNEYIDSPANVLYSHSFTFNYADPFTHTGIEFDYPVNDKLSTYFGVVWGWDDFAQVNHSVTFNPGATYKITDKISTTLQALIGPEEFNDNRDYRTLVESLTTFQVTDALSFTLDGQAAYEPGTASSVGAVGDGHGWYGVTGYANYTFNTQVAANVRMEYFHDQTGSRVGTIAPATELTVGLDIHPLKDFLNLRVRPEVRWDHAYHGEVFDEGVNHNQITLAADVILTF